MFRNSAIRAQHDPTLGNMNMTMHTVKHSRPEAVNTTLTIRSNDVLCGRGKISFNHSGNRRFRHIISQSSDEYKAAGSKWEKSLVAAKLVSVIHSTGGRFLKQKKSNEDEWYELSSSECKSKVSHAIRDAIAATRQSRRPSLEGPSSSPSSPSASPTSTKPVKKIETSSTDKASEEPKPLFRGTWSSNSLVSLTDDSEKVPERTSSSSSSKTKKATKPVSDESYSSSDESSSDGDDYEDDFLSFINDAVGPTLVKNKE